MARARVTVLQFSPENMCTYRDEVAPGELAQVAGQLLWLVTARIDCVYILPMLDANAAQVGTSGLRAGRDSIYTYNLFISYRSNKPNPVLFVPNSE